MFNRRTLFVLGAGASAEVGLPIGSDLAKIISQKLRGLNAEGVGDQEIARSLYFQAPQDFPNQLSAAQQIADGLPLAKSIDSFLHTHRDDPNIARVGKLAIVKAIMEKESVSRLAEQRAPPGFGPVTIDPYALDDTWFVKFFRIFGDGTSKSAMAELFGRTSFISFNYDRTLETFLLRAVRHHYAMDEQTAASLVNQAYIFHPYGSIGRLPWQTEGNANAVPYGGFNPQRLDEQTLMRMAKGIRTYTERIAESDALTRMKQEVADAETIIFLGFGFHQQNMDLLTPNDRCQQLVRVLATTFGMSNPNSREVTGRIQQMVIANSANRSLAGPLVVHNSTCAGLFDEYGLIF